MAHTPSVNIIDKILENEKVIIINAFRNIENGKKIIGLEDKLFLHEITKQLLEAYRYFHPFYLKGEEFAFPPLKEKLFQMGKKYSIDELEVMFKAVPANTNIHHNINFLTANKAKIDILDGKESPYDRFTKACKNM